MKSLGFVLIFACGVLLYGCARNGLPKPSDLPSFGNLPFVHKIDIQQGNVITQEMIAQLELGMDKKKVIFIMGSPVILDTFHADRWDYLYLFKHGGGHSKRRQITLYFEQSKLARIEGNVTPAAGKLVVDTRQDMTVDVPGTSRQGLMAKIKDTIPFVGDAPPPAKSTAHDKRAVVIPEDEVPEFQAPLKAAPVLTPMERAAREEQGGPGVLAKIKDAMPFSGDATADVADPENASRAQTSAPAQKPTAGEEVAGEKTAKSTDSPSLLAKLKGALPFSKTGQAPENTPSERKNSRTPRAASPSDGAVLEDDEDSSQAPDDADNADATQNTVTVTAPPPSAPTAFPLENQLRDTPTRVETNRARADQEEDQGIDVPAQKTPKKRGFFARLFGKDRPHEEASDPDNRGRRYRDISDPEAN